MNFIDLLNGLKNGTEDNFDCFVGLLNKFNKNLSEDSLSKVLIRIRKKYNVNNDKDIAQLTLKEVIDLLGYINNLELEKDYNKENREA